MTNAAKREKPCETQRVSIGYSNAISAWGRSFGWKIFGLMARSFEGRFFSKKKNIPAFFKKKVFFFNFNFFFSIRKKKKMKSKIESKKMQTIFSLCNSFENLFLKRKRFSNSFFFSLKKGKKKEKKREILLFFFFFNKTLVSNFFFKNLRSFFLFRFLKFSYKRFRKKKGREKNFRRKLKKFQFFFFFLKSSEI